LADGTVGVTAVQGRSPSRDPKNLLVRLDLRLPTELTQGGIRARTRIMLGRDAHRGGSFLAGRFP
jgi:hypothetical protein